MIRLLSFLLVLPLIVFFTVNVGDLVLKYRNSALTQPPVPVYVPQQIVGRKDLQEVDVLIVGGSSTREFFGHDTALDDILSAQCGGRTRGFNAATSSQSLSESLAVIDLYRAHVGDPDVIVVGLTTRRLSLPDYDPLAQAGLFNLALAPSSSSFSWYEWPVRVLSSATGALQRFSGFASLLSPSSTFNLDGIHPPHPAAPYDGREPLSLAQRTSMSVVWAEIIDSDAVIHAERSARWGAGALDRATNDIPVVYLMTPVSPASAPLAYPDSDSEVMQRSIQHLTGNNPFLDLRDSGALGLTDADFWDEQHLILAGRERLWAQGLPSFAQALCSVIDRR
jgi:hypothetical protein